MNFLIVYGTTEGQTRKISQFVADRIRTHAHEVTLLDSTSDTARDAKLHGFDGVIIAASLHVGMYQAAIEDFVRSRHDTLNSLRTAFLSVSLAAASKDSEDLRGLEKCVERFTMATSWRPGEIDHVSGAFRYTQYDFFKRWGMRLIAYERGVSTDARHDLELTDWARLASIADVFVAKVAKAKIAAA